MAGGGNDQLLNTGLMIAAGIAAPALAPALMSGGALGLGLSGAAATGLTGAALGGLAGAVTGQDVGKSALMGGLGGAASGYLGGVNAAEQGSMLAAGPTTPGAGLSTLPSTIAPANVANAGLQNSLGNSGQLVSGLDLGSGAVEGARQVMPPAGTAFGATNQAQMIGGGAAGINALLSAPPNGAYVPPDSVYKGGPLQRFKYDPDKYQPDIVRPPTPIYRPQYAEGGIASLAMGGVPTRPPTTNFANPASYEEGTSQYSMATDPMSGNIANRMASGGIAELAVGGKLLRGDGDGMSDSINANIAGSQQARLADGEFVIPADVVSHLGNGSTDAGAKHLYSMMDKVRKARVGTKKQGKQINPNKFIPV